MALSLLNNLYPPIIDTYMPAFIHDEQMRVYFSISPFNTFKQDKDTDIDRNVQITVVNQKTNKSALDPSLYPSLIKISEVKEDITKKSDDRFYIVLDPKVDLKAKDFEVNQFYMIQIRFTCKYRTDGTEIAQETGRTPASWFTDNLDYFSEWSTVCLIKGIEQPVINLNINTILNGRISNPTLTVYGRLEYDSALTAAQEETLKSYKLILKDDSGVCVESDVIYTAGNGDPNEINYTFPYYLESGKNYIVVFSYTTINLYSHTEPETELICEYDENETDVNISVEVNNDDGYFKVILSKENAPFTYNSLLVRRTSSKSNFKIWETVKIFNGVMGTDNVFFNDRTIESGVWYKYFAQYQLTSSVLTSPTIITEPKMVVFDDLLLTTNTQQLAVKYNPNINSFKYNIIESKTDTIGNKYAIISRNGNVKYRQMSLSGLIHSSMDSNGLFITENDLYSEEVQELYRNYRLDNNIGINQDHVLERDFRNKVMDFLYDNSIKLCRSTTEGNILVKIMNINLSPQTNLGRLVYSFNAELVEIADATLENMNLYKVHNLTNEIEDKDYNYFNLQSNGSLMEHKEGEEKWIMDSTTLT